MTGVIRLVSPQPIVPLVMLPPAGSPHSWGPCTQILAIYEHSLNIIGKLLLFYRHVSSVHLLLFYHALVNIRSTFLCVCVCVCACVCVCVCVCALRVHKAENTVQPNTDAHPNGV